jgi:hypothetical protein
MWLQSLAFRLEPLQALGRKEFRSQAQFVDQDMGCVELLNRSETLKKAVVHLIVVHHHTDERFLDDVAIRMR